MDKHEQLKLNHLDDILYERLHETAWTETARNSVKLIVDLLKKDGFKLTHTYNNEWEVTIVLVRDMHVYYIGRAKDTDGKWLTYIQHTEKGFIQ